jgi:hypothetical protein
MAVALVILSALVGFSSQQLRQIEEQRSVKAAQDSLDRLVKAADAVYAQGKGSTRSVDIIWPSGIDHSYTSISDHTVQVRAHNRIVYAEAVPLLTGSLPTSPGYHPIRVRAFEGFVTIGEVSLSVSPSKVFSPMDRNDSSSYTLTFLNAGEDVNIMFTADWNHTDIDLNLSRNDLNISDGNTGTLDVNFYSDSTATGTYSGKLWARGTYADRVETLLIPLKASIALGSESDLQAYPSTLSITTYATDTNGVSIQLCNVGDVPLKSITFTPSMGDAGDWIQGISPISSLSPLTCTQVEVNATPSSSTVGEYEGSLYVSDYLGQNTISIPITVIVGGMDVLFQWDWSTAVKSTNAIRDFTLRNVGNVPLTLDEVRLRNWITCDSQDSNVTVLKFNDTTLYSTPTVDGNWMDIPDTNIPVLTAWTSNEIQFAGNIGDENETFIADVLFGDGSVYSSSTYGSGCADMTAPAKVSDLVAYSGSDARSVELRFTYPGDDGNAGAVSSVDLRYSNGQSLSNESSFALGIPFEYDGPFPAGGTQGSILITDLNVGQKYYFALKFSDDNGNTGPLSGNPTARPWNSFQWTMNDFDFPNMPYSVPLVGTGDVNQFVLSNIQLDLTGNYTLAFRIAEDEDENSGWTCLMDFNTTSLTRVRIWYPTNRDYVPQTTANYDVSKSISISSPINLLTGSFANATYRYNGTAVTMMYPNQFKVIQISGVSDFNVTTDKTEPLMIGGP